LDAAGNRKDRDQWGRYVKLRKDVEEIVDSFD